MFVKVVELYRKIGRPELDNGLRVEATVSGDPELDELRASLRHVNPEFGDYNFITRSDGTVTVEITLPSATYRFFDTLSSFIRLTPSLRKGVARDNYYIRELDYSSTDGVERTPREIKNIFKAAEFISALRKFSLVASHSGDLGDQDKIFFLQPAKSGNKTLVIPLEFSECFPNIEVGGFKILEYLSASDYQDKFHIEERQLIMSVAISDVAREADASSDLVFHLAKNWREVIRRYRHDLSAYVRNFAFEGERKKIADAAIDYSAKLNSALGEMTTKIIAAPISVAVILALSKVSSEVDYWAGVAGVIIAFVVYFIALKNQQKQVERLTNAYAFILNGLIRKKATFDSSLRKELGRFEEEAQDQKSSLKRAIKIYWAIAYLPLIAIFLTTIFRYLEELISIFHAIWTCV